MKLYQITYYAAEVHHHHHSNLPRKIQSLGAWAQIMPNTFLLHTELNANEIKLALNEVKQDNEIFFASQVTEENSGSLHPGAHTWIENHLK